MINDHQARCLAEAVGILLGKDSPGNMAFVRCLGAEELRDLSGHPQFQVPGWEIYGVVDKADSNQRLITADQAVEMREGKGPATLLLVDPEKAGAGMDGIYSAAREITERELYEKANELVFRDFPHGRLGWAKDAVKKARRLGITSRHTISPWKEFAFYVHSSEKQEDIGGCITRLGLWPIKIYDKPDKSDLDKSARLIERLLLATGTVNTPAMRVAGLLLPESTDPRQIQNLTEFIRQAAGRHWQEAVSDLVDKPDLWLNELQPGIFDLSTLKKLEIVPWRKNPQNKPFAWSGLKLTEGELLPQFILNLQPASAKERSKLEVQWRTYPEDLKAGAVEYRVVVLSGDEELAEKKILHSTKSPQKSSFTEEDFLDELEVGSKFEAKIQIQAIGSDSGHHLDPIESEDFLLIVGQDTGTTQTGAGKAVRALVEGAINLENEDDFRQLCQNRSAYREDRNGFISFRAQSKSAKVFRPPLIRDVEQDWNLRNGEIGRWWITVRADGSRVGPLNFEPLGPGPCSENLWKRVVSVNQAFCNLVSAGCGLIGLIYDHPHRHAEDYLNSWTAVLDEGAPSLSLVYTIEVRSLSGKTLGLIVPPVHPLRVAWHYAYDTVVYFARFEDKMRPATIGKILRELDGSRFPFVLPGLRPGETFIFGDTLGFYAVAMVLDTDREPKAALAIMASSLAPNTVDIAPSVGKSASKVLGREIAHYLMLHPKYHTLHVHAIRPGDGMTITRALGHALEQYGADEEGDGGGKHPPAFVLNLFPSNEQTGMVGRFLSLATERRRSGAGASSEDAWIQDTLVQEGQVTIPRLRWAKRDSEDPEIPAHMAVAFNAFVSRVMCLPKEQLENDGHPLSVFGLTTPVIRRFKPVPTPTWDTFISLVAAGEKHPLGRILTERLERIQGAVLRAVSRSLGGTNDTWPVLRTEISLTREESLQNLHTLCDWVITLDQNAGIEYYDSPKTENLKSIYDAYIIDCVPEREDLGLMQLVTSTANLSEVQLLLDESLQEMGISASARNCIFLMEQLKALSGRLAMRLTAQGVKPGELIALALVYANCLGKNDANSVWLDLQEGFFVLLDDVRELLADKPQDLLTPEEESRADLLYVTIARRGGLLFRFVEVKYRRYLVTARNPKLVDDISRQVGNTRNRWENLYLSKDLKAIERSVRRHRLAKILCFYADKARRHHLGESAYEEIKKEIDKMVREGEKYQFATTFISTPFDRGYIFCPDIQAPKPIPFAVTEQIGVYLFGQAQIPDSQGRHEIMPQPDPLEVSGRSDDSGKEVSKKSIPSDRDKQEDESSRQLAMVMLGESLSLDEPVGWNISIRGNPHLMIVGQPGMGKTTCLINICQQLFDLSINPIIFSYHEDIDAKLLVHFGDLYCADYNGLGFNPLKVISSSPRAYIDNAGMIRDIFSAIFPELGDLQLDSIRQAIKQSYLELGWDDLSRNRTDLIVPDFQTFYEILKSLPKTDKGLMARLGELDDYDFFRCLGDNQDLFSINKPIIVRIHLSQNQVLQRAFANFVLYNLYQSMFLRGEQPNITHAIVFDEAHRASRLNLLPTFAKECRKFGISSILASQEARDFNSSLFAAIGNYLILKLTETDAKTLARNVTSADNVRLVADKIKQLPKYQAAFFTEGKRRPIYLALKNI